MRRDALSPRRLLRRLAPLALLACARAEDSSAQGAHPSGQSPGAPARTTEPPPPSPEAARALLRTAPRASSPHWPHARFHIGDFRISYLDAPLQRGEYAWTAAHFDRIILDFGDLGSVPHYRKLNPGARIYRYALSWTVIRPGQIRREYPATAYTTDMREWYARNPRYRLEDAFLHDAARCAAGAPASESCRVEAEIWGQRRWAINPGDPGLRAYHRERLSRLASDADGVFLDEHGSWDMEDALAKHRLREYPDLAAYRRDIVTLLGEIRSALGSERRLIINTAKSMEAWDLEMAKAAGGIEAEHANAAPSPRMEGRWTFIDSALAAGVLVELVSDLNVPAGFTAGASKSPEARRNLFQLASYHLIAPSPPDLLGFGPGTKFDQPFERLWFGALEADIGRPRGARRVHAEGKGPDGRAYRVWSRAFDRALVLVRPALGDAESFGDAGAVRVPLPPGERWLPLQADGSLGAAVTAAVALRPGEAAILVRIAPGGGS